MDQSTAHSVEEIIARVGTHPVWGYSHCLRVYELAKDLARDEGLEYNGEVLYLAALLHDIGLYRAYNLREAADHAERSASVAGRILRDADHPAPATRLVVEAIRAHQPGSRPAPSAESTLLNDAICLDYLGSIGMGRILAMVGSEEDVPDLRTAVSHAEGLRRSLPGTLNLEASRYLAEERVLETDSFIETLRHSTNNLKLL
ncbi:HD domain-containing protein [Rubrobacter indicoceani]|uniref:HD domain-containing protein n=1 Tax=Rubrobacter indicoceani TaxID=2051957 RepID=UPI000E5A65BB|nr:HD domain-containing protein [Rubrobacter indicoceani]